VDFKHIKESFDDTKYSKSMIRQGNDKNQNSNRGMISERDNS